MPVNDNSTPKFPNEAKEKTTINMKVFIVLALTLIGTKAFKMPGVDSQCPSDTFVESQCVTYHDTKMTLFDAGYTCFVNYGGYLFETRTEEGYHALAKLASESGQKMWLGAVDIAEGDWRWLSDNSSAILPKKWFASGEPNKLGGNEKCLQMEPNGKLYDADCGKSFAFACVHNVAA